MAVLLVLLSGVAVVLVGVLLFRLHAAVALLLAAALVAVLTPPHWRLQTEVRARALTWQLVDESSGGDVSPPAARQPPDQTSTARDHHFRLDKNVQERVSLEQPLWIVRFEPSREPTVIGTARVVGTDANSLWLGRCENYKLPPQPGDLLITPADWQAARRAAYRSPGERLAQAFGETCGQIAILIIMASIVGRALFDSGAADAIVRRFLRWFGERRAPWAFWGSGFLLGIPVFFDTVFYLLMPLGKALALRTGKDFLLYTLAIVSGATMTHSLVPPTPGPLFVAQQFQVDLAVMIVAGTAVGLVASLAGLLFAARVNRQYVLPLRETVGFSLEELKRQSDRDERQLPPFFWSILPILLPVVLISARAARQSLGWRLPGLAENLLQTVGEQNVALMISAALAVALVVRQGTGLASWATALQSAVVGAGSIILITASGGTFGAMLRQTGVAYLMNIPAGTSLAWLLVAFLVTSFVRTAQGSATVAMITAAGIFSSLATPEVLGFHPVYLALAIGCGSKPLAWMNDSGFWVICQMSGMTEQEALRFVTPMSLIMGIAGLVATMVGAYLFPLIG